LARLLVAVNDPTRNYRPFEITSIFSLICVIAGSIRQA
jgi:hypothetical protein